MYGTKQSPKFRKTSRGHHQMHRLSLEESEAAEPCE